MKLKNIIQIMLDDYIQEELNRPGELKNKFKNKDDFDDLHILMDSIREWTQIKDERNNDKENEKD